MFFYDDALYKSTLSIYVSVCLSVCLSIYLSIYLSNIASCSTSASCHSCQYNGQQLLTTDYDGRTMLTAIDDT